MTAAATSSPPCAALRGVLRARWPRTTRPSARSWTTSARSRQQLAGEKEELTAALANLAGGARQGRAASCATTASCWSRTSRTSPASCASSATSRRPCETVLDIAPSSMGNLAVAFDPKSGSIGSRLTVKGNRRDLDGFLCTLATAGRGRRRPTWPASSSPRCSGRCRTTPAGAGAPALPDPADWRTGCRAGSATARRRPARPRSPGSARLGAHLLDGPARAAQEVTHERASDVRRP